MSDEAVIPEPEGLFPANEITKQPAPASTAPRFDTEPYVVTGPTPVFGTLLLFTLLPLAGLLVGMLTSVIEQWIYLIILFPIGMGLIVGVVGNRLVKLGKARSAVVIWPAVAVAGIVTMLGLHYGGYLLWLNAFENANQNRGLLIGQFANPEMFVTYMDLQATAGVTIGHVGHPGDRGINLGYYGSIIYWIVEAGFATGMIFALISAAATAPLCEHCQSWKKERKLARLPGQADMATGSLVDGHLLSLIGAGSRDGTGDLVVYAYVCPVCGPDATVEAALVHLTTNAKGTTHTKRLCCVRYPGQVLPLLDSPGGRA
jgi:hypothetical protein